MSYEYALRVPIPADAVDDHELISDLKGHWYRRAIGEGYTPMSVPYSVFVPETADDKAMSTRTLLIRGQVT